VHNVFRATIENLEHQIAALFAAGLSGVDEFDAREIAV
jgi:hypothetical protein